jgi:hypothetical protein
MNQASPTRLTVRRRFLVLSLATLGLSPLGSQSARAASGNWNAAPTNGFWEASGTENNWSTGAGTFPGTTTADSITNTDVATFNAISAITTISIDATASNSSPLNLATIGFTGGALSSYTIGSTTGNALVMTSNANQGSTVNQIFISGGGRSGASSSVIETINAPIVLAPQSSTTAGFRITPPSSPAATGWSSMVPSAAERPPRRSH